MSSIRSNLPLLVLLLLTFVPLITQSAHVIRAAIDVGSGGPKLRVAEVDLVTNKIVKVLHVQQYPVIFQESLSLGSNRVLGHEIMSHGLRAINHAIASAKSFGANDIVIIGTSVFRNAVNGYQFAKDIGSETGLQVHVIDQDLEGKLAFEAALAKMDIASENLIVWDIGGGSMQVVAKMADKSYLVHESNEGSGPFRDFIIESIQQRSLNEHRSPNPLSSVHANVAEAYANDLSVKVGPIFKNKISKSGTKIVGVGSVFGRGIAHLVNSKNSFTVDELAIVVNKLLGKTDADLGGGDFACIVVSNALLVLGFMKGLGIKEICIADVNNADGAMIYEPFWR